jgi:hypothetical protein
MMTLNDQIQSFVYSILIGMVFTFIWSFFNRVFYKLKGTFRRLVFEAVLFSMFGVVYYYLLFLINNGVLNIYLPLGLLVGVVIYQLYYVAFTKSDFGQGSAIAIVFFIQCLIVTVIINKFVAREKIEF